MKLISSMLMAVLLSGCAAGSHTRTLSMMFGSTVEGPVAMRSTHLVGWVTYDEASFIKYRGAGEVGLYAAGVRKDGPLVQYRSIPVTTPRIEKAILWKKDGWIVDTLGALVPDHIGALKKGDIVEWRSISFWDSP